VYGDQAQVRLRGDTAFVAYLALIWLGLAYFAVIGALGLLYVWATVWLLQKGSPESKEQSGNGTDEEQHVGRYVRADSPAMLRRGGTLAALYSRSLCSMMAALPRASPSVAARRDRRHRLSSRTTARPGLSGAPETRAQDSASGSVGTSVG
jgi:hypothetical protein